MLGVQMAISNGCPKPHSLNDECECELYGSQSSSCQLVGMPVSVPANGLAVLVM